MALIAEKTPQMESRPNAYHSQLCLSDLMGNKIAMDGRIHLAGGIPVKSAAGSGIVFEESPEARAFARWQDGQFLDAERETAKNWRGMLANLQFSKAIEILKKLGINPKTCSSLEHAKTIASQIVSNRGSEAVILFALRIIGAPPFLWTEILKRWKAAGSPPLAEFAAYAAYVTMVDLFFYIGIASGRISVSGKKITNRIDLAYLYYLPFCMLFRSSDKFHRSCALLFLRNDQEFVWGPELKAELRRLNEYYLGMPEAEREKGLYAIAGYPPINEGSLTTRLYDRFLRPVWREPKSIDPAPQKQREIIERLNREIEDAVPAHEIINSDTAKFLRLEKKVQMKRGSYWQLPKNLPVKHE